MSERRDEQLSDEQHPDDDPGAGAGQTAASGTPDPVDVRRDRRWRWAYLVFLAGPVLWFVHFGLVYLVAEAGCTGGGQGLERLDPPVPSAVTIIATVVFVAATLATAEWGRRGWRAAQGRRGDRAADQHGVQTVENAGWLCAIGAMLSVSSALAIVFVGVGGMVFRGC